MSMSITGFKTNTNDFADIDAKLIEWRGVIRKSAHEKLVDFYAKEVTHKLDDQYAKNEGYSPTGNLLGDIFEDLRQRQKKIKETQARDPRIDFDFTVCLYPFEGSTFGVVFTEHSEWRKKFFRLPWVSNYAYWDNSDKDSKVTIKEWNERGRIWREMFSGPHHAYGSRGFKVECGSDQWATRLVSRSEIVKQIVPFQDRLKRVATNRIVHRQMQQADEVDDPKDETSWASRYMRAYHDWLPTEGAQAMLAIEMGHLSSILPRKITADML